MKLRVTSIVVLFVMILSLTGYYPVFKLEQWKLHNQFKKMVKAEIPKNQLIRFVVNRHNERFVNWIKKDKEFRYKGRMYDVVKAENSQQGMIYYCINDQQETRLFARLDSLIKDYFNSNTNPVGMIAKVTARVFFHMVYIPMAVHKMYVYHSKFPYLELPSNRYNSGFIQLISPPPRQIS